MQKAPYKKVSVIVRICVLMLIVLAVAFSINNFIACTAESDNADFCKPYCWIADACNLGSSSCRNAGNSTKNCGSGDT